MDEREFLDKLYQLWSKTTGAEDRFWMPEEDKDYYVQGGGPGTFNIFAVGQDESRKDVASLLSDEDSDFITAIHGSFPDLYRRTLEAYDQADRLDVERDSQECRIAELEMEVSELRAELEAR